MPCSYLRTGFDIGETIFAREDIYGDGATRPGLIYLRQFRLSG
jgi:hypothetical protein